MIYGCRLIYFGMTGITACGGDPTDLPGGGLQIRETSFAEDGMQSVELVLLLRGPSLSFGFKSWQSAGVASCGA